MTSNIDLSENLRERIIFARAKSLSKCLKASLMLIHRRQRNMDGGIGGNLLRKLGRDAHGSIGRNFCVELHGLHD